MSALHRVSAKRLDERNVAYLLSVRTVEPEKQPSPYCPFKRGSVSRVVDATVRRTANDTSCGSRTDLQQFEIIHHCITKSLFLIVY
jgi:hypothetical protein